MPIERGSGVDFNVNVNYAAGGKGLQRQAKDRRAEFEWESGKWVESSLWHESFFARRNVHFCIVILRYVYVRLKGLLGKVR